MSKVEGRPMRVEIASAGIRRNARVLETQRRSKANQFTDDAMMAMQEAEQMLNTPENKQRIELEKAHKTIFDLLQINAGLDSTIKHIAKNWGEKQSLDPDSEVQEIFDRNMDKLAEHESFNQSLHNWIDQHLQGPNPDVGRPNLKRKKKPEQK